MGKRDDPILEMIDSLFGDVKLSKFRNKIALLLEEVQEVDGEDKLHYASIVMSFASITLAEELVWHLEDHNGTKCVIRGVSEMTEKFTQVVTHHVKTLTERRGLEDPFAALDVNAALAAEIHASIAKEVG